METVAFCEIEEYPRRVLKKHWPGVPIYEDIKQLTRERLIKDGIITDTTSHTGDLRYELEGDGRSEETEQTGMGGAGNEQSQGAGQDRTINSIDLVCGGFPCQPFSQAGKQEGFGDDRDLWPEMFRVIQEVRPRWVIGENVAGFINMGLDRTLSDLEGAGFRTEQVVIPACAIGAPHRRDRIWIVAHRDSESGEIRGDDKSDEGKGGGGRAHAGGSGSNDSGVFRTKENVAMARDTKSNRGDQIGSLRQGEGTDAGGICEDVAHSKRNAKRSAYGSDSGGSERGREKQDFSQWDEMGGDTGNGGEDVADSGGIGGQAGIPEQGQREEWEPEKFIDGRPGGTVCDTPEQGFQDRGKSSMGESGEVQEPERSDWWAVEPDVGRVAHGIPKRVDRLKGLGNAVVPQIPEIIGRMIMEIEGLKLK